MRAVLDNTLVVSLLRTPGPYRLVVKIQDLRTCPRRHSTPAPSPLESSVLLFFATCVASAVTNPEICISLETGERGGAHTREMHTHSFLPFRSRTDTNGESENHLFPQTHCIRPWFPSTPLRCSFFHPSKPAMVAAALYYFSLLIGGHASPMRRFLTT